MYTRGQMEGILITLARPEITIFRSDANNVDYVVRLRVIFRSTSYEFLEAMQRTLHQYMIKCILKNEESSQRQAPILIVGNQQSIIRLIRLKPSHIPYSYGQWELFSKMMTAVEDRQHLDKEGILEMKEWFDDYKKSRKTDINSRWVWERKDN
jgi:hypothetical protein